MVKELKSIITHASFLVYVLCKNEIFNLRDAFGGLAKTSNITPCILVEPIVSTKCYLPIFYTRFIIVHKILILQTLKFHEPPTLKEPMLVTTKELTQKEKEKAKDPKHIYLTQLPFVLP